MEVLKDPAAMTAWSKKQNRAGKSIALVPTMGFLHEGHISLMRLAARHADLVVVSLFVNPVQFAPGEDFERYPRDFARDSELVAQEGVAVLFAPEPQIMYPEGFQTSVTVMPLGQYLCGASRPTHFAGVTTVVAKFFHIVKPDCAVFGEKDLQQLVIIRRMVRDLNMDIQIIGHPIVREKDGLALSSRNTYLDEKSRESALCLFKSLQLARERAAAGLLDPEIVTEEIREYILTAPGMEIDYIRFVDRENLEPVARIDQNTVLTLAVKMNKKVRLIDNGLVFQSEQPFGSA